MNDIERFVYVTCHVIGRRLTCKKLTGKEGARTTWLKGVSQKRQGPGAEEERPPMTAEQFEASPEFRKFRSAMRKAMKVSKTELDHRVRLAKEISRWFGNPNAPGHKAHK